MRFILKLIFFLLAINSNAQNGARLINYHEKDVNEDDLNQLYINQKVIKISKFDSNCFNPGYIIKAKDTVKCFIYLKKNKLNIDSYLYILVKFNHNNDIYVLTGKDISGYMVKGAFFLSHSSSLKTINSYSFIKFIETGKITLYQRDKTPCNAEFEYLFKKQGEESLSIITPFADNILYYNEWTNEDGSRQFSVASKNIDEKFKMFFREYFSDCSRIANLISTGYYTIINFATIVNEYNHCN